MRSGILRRTLPWLVILLSILSAEAERIGPVADYRSVFGWRGGNQRTDSENENNSNSNQNNNSTVEAYVAAMKEKDSRGATEPGDGDDSDLDHATAENTNTHEDASPPHETSNSEEPAIVGVKSHHHHHKKSNAVGDPDGGDDDDDSDESLTDFSDEWEDIEEFEHFVEDIVVEPELQVEVELVEESGGEETDEESKPSGGGGVGVRLGRMNNRRKRNSWRSTSSPSKTSQDQQRLLEAWVPHVYFPPGESALAYLSENARLLDATSKNRLDRRTLYAGLLMEWGSVDTKVSSGRRKFLPPAVSQSLQAALSMATQPQWRQSAPRTSGVRLYQDNDNASKAATLSMQETVAMALVRSLLVYLL